MSIRIQDPLFLLSAQTGLNVGELKAKAADGNPDVEKPQEALQTGEPIPLIFCRRRNGNGGVMTQPKATEAFFSNSIVEEEISISTGATILNPVERVQVKYLLVLSEGELPQVQIRDVFHGSCRRGTFNQAYDARAGSWSPGNEIYDFFDYTATQNETYGYYQFNILTLEAGESVNFPDSSVFYYKDSRNFTGSMPRQDYGFPVFCGTSGSYDELTTFSFEHSFDGRRQLDDIKKTISIFIRKGLKVTRLKDGVTGPSDNFADFAKYLFEKNDRLAAELIDTDSLTIAAKFVDANSFFFNGKLTESQNLVDWLQTTSINFLLRVTNIGGKFGLLPRLPYNSDFTIKTTQITPKFTFTEEHVVPGGFEIEYISLDDKSPVCFVIQWRQQPEADFGLVRTVQVRHEDEALSGPFVNIDMSNYCTNEDHAVKVGAFYLAQRRHVMHHLRLTVRERSYNTGLAIGDIVRVRLQRETNRGELTYHDFAYEINRIEKTFSSTIVYDLTHFPLDENGRSIVARQVAASSGAGNTIDVGRSSFSCDVNSSTSTSTVGTTSGGGGSNQPSETDTVVEAVEPLQPDGFPSMDSAYPGGLSQTTDADLLDDPLDLTLDGSDSSNPQITGYTGSTPETGDTLSYSPGCPNALIKWYKININTGVSTLIGSGVGATLSVSQALAQEGVRVYGEGYCPDPSSDTGYGPPITSNQVELFDEIIDCPGGGDSGGQGTYTKIINVGSAYPASFTFTYTAYTIQDRFVISGAASLDTGYVSGINVSTTVQKTSSNPYITVTVYAPTSGTAWSYSVGCAS